MKLKLKKARGGVTNVLVGVSGKDEEFNYVEAECVKCGCDETLLTFSYENKKKGYSFIYYLGSARPVVDYLSIPLSQASFEAILRSFLDLARACDNNGLSMQRVVFDVEYIFFDPGRFLLKFVYLPVKTTLTAKANPLDAIINIIRHATFADGMTKRLADAILDYILRCSIFSWIDYEAQLKSYGILDEKTLFEPTPLIVEKKRTANVDGRDSFGYNFVSDVISKQNAGDNFRAGSPDSSISDEQGSHLTSYTLVRIDNASSWPLREGSTVLGRLDSCDITISDIAGVSRRHAVIRIQKGVCSIEDLDSTNGTRVNGEKIIPRQPMRLVRGNQIQIVKTVFEIR